MQTAAQTPTCELVSCDPLLSRGHRIAACAGGRSPSSGKSALHDLWPGKTHLRSWCSFWRRCSEPTCKEQGRERKKCVFALFCAFNVHFLLKALFHCTRNHLLLLHHGVLSLQNQKCEQRQKKPETQVKLMRTF